MYAHLPPFATKQLRTSRNRLIEIALRSQFHTGATLHAVTGRNGRTGKRIGVGRGRGPRVVPATTRGLVECRCTQLPSVSLYSSLGSESSGVV